MTEKNSSACESVLSHHENQNVYNYKISRELPIPKYLEETYWWAYIHPKAVQLFEKQWLINLILWGNFARLRDLALNEMGQTIEGNNLQVACVYGDFSQQIASRLSPESKLHIVDIVPVQLKNVCNKVSNHQNVFIHHQDSSNLHFEESCFDNVIVFFLLHEQPVEIRNKTAQEALRVVKPGGKIIFIDYHKPYWINPLRYIMMPVLRFLEPFAHDLWNKEIVDFLPENTHPKVIRKEILFGGLYQKVVIVR